MVEARSVNNVKNATNLITLSYSIIAMVLALLYCVCVIFQFILDIKFGGRISQGHTGGRSHRSRKVTPDFSPAFLLRCVPYIFSREGFSHSFPSSAVKPNFVYLTI